MSEKQGSTSDDVEALLSTVPANAVHRTPEGDLSFRTPWELRGLAIGVAAYERASFNWPDFQSALVSDIKDWEQAAEPADDWQYYTHWVNALTAMLVGSGVVDEAELDARTREILATPRDATHQHAHHDPVSVDH